MSKKTKWTRFSAEELYNASQKPEKRVLLSMFPFSVATLKTYGDNTGVLKYEDSLGNVRFFLQKRKQQKT